MSRRNKIRPVVVTIDRGPCEPDRDGNCYPAGRPTVTSMRPMTWWEHARYKAKGVWRRLHRQPPLPPQLSADNPFIPALSIGVRMSDDQYASLIQGDPKTVAAANYLKRGGVVSMEFVAPPPRLAEVGEYTV